MNVTGKNILVIGGAGFIGSHVAQELLETDVASVTTYDNFTWSNPHHISESRANTRCRVFPDGNDIREIDVQNAAMRGADGVMHLSAKLLLHCNDYPRFDFDVNVQGTFNVHEACVIHNVERLVFSISASVYGDTVEVPLTEDHPFNNRNSCVAMEIAGESLRA